MQKVYIYMIGLILMTLSCNSLNEDLPTRYGELSVMLGDPDIEVLTKVPESLSPEDPAAASYTISIYDSSNQFVRCTTYNHFGNQVLPLGTYYVTAENCTESESESGRGQMRLFGKSENVTLSLENMIQTVGVNCSVQNAKLTVSFDAMAAEHIDDLKVELYRTSPERTLTVSETDGETAVWFNPSEVTYAISGTYRGKSVSFNGSVNLSAKSNVKIAVKINADKGELFIPDVQYDTIDTENNVSGEFNPYV